MSPLFGKRSKSEDSQEPAEVDATTQAEAEDVVVEDSVVEGASDATWTEEMCCLPCRIRLVIERAAKT